jgi:hypothetical protein
VTVVRWSLDLDRLAYNEALGYFELVSARSTTLRPAFEKVMDVWEDIEGKVFSDGVLVDTGHLMASLTGRGGDAIREIHGYEIGFGTNVPYARPVGKKTGHRVLADPPRVSDEIVLAYIVGEEAVL